MQEKIREDIRMAHLRYLYDNLSNPKYKPLGIDIFSACKKSFISNVLAVLGKIISENKDQYGLWFATLLLNVKYPLFPKPKYTKSTNLKEIRKTSRGKKEKKGKTNND